MIKDLTRRLDDLQACNDLMLKQGSGLQRALSDLEMIEPPSLELAAKFKIVSERATLFRIAANAMISVSSNQMIIKNAKLYDAKYQRMMFFFLYFSQCQDINNHGCSNFLVQQNLPPKSLNIFLKN